MSRAVLLSIITGSEKPREFLCDLAHQFRGARFPGMRDQANCFRAHMKNSWLPSAPVMGAGTIPAVDLAMGDDELLDFPLRLLMQHRIADDSAATHVLRLQFELRFDEGKNHTVGS